MYLFLCFVHGICSAAAAGSMEARLTIAKTPPLVTKTRTRKVTVQSQVQKEKKEIEDMKKYIDCINILGFSLQL